MAETVGKEFRLNPQADGLLYTEDIPLPTTALGLAAASMSSGQLLDISTWSPAIPTLRDQQIAEGRTTGYTNWQMRFYYDAANRRVINWSKDVQSNPTLLDVYYEDTNTWRRVQTINVGTSGHPFGNHCGDPATGDSFFQNWGGGTIYKYRASDDSYNTSDVAPTIVGTHPAHGMAWHPNLYGAGVGGLILRWTTFFGFWNSQTNQWESSATIPAQYNLGYGQGEYLAETDECIFPRGEEGTASFKVVPAGGATPTVQSIADPPIQVPAGSVSSPTDTDNATIVRDPVTPSSLMLLRHGGEVYRSSDGVSWVQGANHGFGNVGPSNGGFIYCSIPAYGVIWGTGANNRNELWKP
jgi:hypothetical protein